MPLGQIDLPITFGGPSNYRTEILTSKVVGFHETYHAILGRPCYAKLMPIPNYTCLKLKMLGPHSVITIGTSFQRAFECKVESYELALATLTSEELAAIEKDIAKGAPDVKWAAGSFETTENIKEVLVDPDNSADKMLHIGTTPSPK